MKSLLGIFFQLIRLRLATMVAASALVGYVLHLPFPDPAAALLTAGVFLLASGCSALNQVQERRLDARMQRTRHRPLPAGRLRVPTAAVLALMLLGAGFSILAAVDPGWTFGLGLFAVLWYNGVYTPLKPRTSLALPLGAICGALPPLMGWAASGGSINDYRIVILAGLILLWQIPHFWLFARRHREDLERAGLPRPLAGIDERRTARIAMVWIFSLATTLLLIASLDIFRQLPVRLLIPLLTAWLVLSTLRNLLRSAPRWGRGYARLNLFLGLFLFSLLVDGLLTWG